MPEYSSSSGPLSHVGSVAIVLLALFLALAGCVERRADGRRGTDADTATASAGSAQKVDTGMMVIPQSAKPQPPPDSLSGLGDIGDAAGTGSAGGATTRAAAPSPSPSTPGTTSGASVSVPATQSEIALLEQRHPIVPISGIPAAKLPDTFNELRGGTRKHEALDILAPRGTPVHSTDDGKVIKLFSSKAGGLTVYVSGSAGQFIYYYAHLDDYAKGLTEGQMVHKGDVLGYVGTTGNADPNVPHLHFAIARNGNAKEWWKGEPVNPTTILQAAASSPL